MMAAGVGAIASQQTRKWRTRWPRWPPPPALTVVGVYFTLFISLPTTIWLYGKLEPVLGRFSRAKADETVAADAVADETPAHGSKLGFGDRLTAYAVCGLFALVGNQFGYKVPILDALPGMLIILALVVLTDLLLRVIPKLPAVFVLSVLADRRLPGVLLRADHRAGARSTSCPSPR